MLYLVSTPIGNLGDLSFRAVDILKTCDQILCEDTRKSRILLRHYQIDKPLSSYHMFNEAKREKGVLAALNEGKEIALISDAGTPGINDPGMRLVKKCVENGIPITPLPGPCSPIVALVASGLTTERFQFIGFLPKRPGKQKKALKEALEYPGTTIAFESPHRILKALKTLEELNPTSFVVVARELTKKFEEFLRGTPQELLDHFTKAPPRGEMVLLIESFTNP